MAAKTPLITVVGYLSIDKIDCPGGVFENVPGGGALYAALGARAAGAQVRLVVKRCRDFPDWALDSLAAQGVDLSALECADGPSRRARLAYRASVNGQPVDIDPAAAVDPEWWARTRALVPGPCSDPADAMVLGAMPAEALDGHLDAARAAGALVVADTSQAYAHDAPEALLARVPRFDLFAPSRGEVRLLYPQCSDREAQTALRRMCGRVAQKRGADGFWWSSAECPFLEFESLARKVVDPTGAGDATVGALAVGLARNLTVPELLRLASEVAARCLAGVGPARLGVPAAAPQSA